MVKMTTVITVTTSMGTKWEAYSQALLRFLVPEWKRLIVNGRTNWSPIGFLSKVVEYDADFVFHIDEDCFVESREALLSIIKIFIDDQRVVAIGVPDGGYYYRSHNPSALNLFFTAFRMSALKKAYENRSLWDQLHFDNTFSQEVMLQCPGLDMSRVNWDEGEPYYPLFWSLLSAGGRFKYLKEELNKTRWSSRIYTPDGYVVAEHMWYLRQWFSRDIMPGHNCPNVDRYMHLKSDLMKKFRTNARFHFMVIYFHMKRIIRRVVK